jgi:hypothetical protein
MVSINLNSRKELLVGIFCVLFCFLSLHIQVWGDPLVTTVNGKRLSLYGPLGAVVGGDCSTEMLLLHPLQYTGGCGIWPAVEEKNSVSFSIESHPNTNELPSKIKELITLLLSGTKNLQYKFSKLWLIPYKEFC